MLHAETAHLTREFVAELLEQDLTQELFLKRFRLRLPPRRGGSSNGCRSGPQFQLPIGLAPIPNPQSPTAIRRSSSAACWPRGCASGGGCSSASPRRALRR